MVINYNFKKGVLAALVLASPFVSAKSDYPAADFQPKVVFSDSDYKHEGGSASSASTKSKAKKAEFDPNFPAANFQPKVVFADDSYQHKDIVASSKTKSVTTAMVENGIESGSIAAESKEDSSQAMLIGLIALAAAGFFFMNKKKAAAPTTSKRSYAPAYEGGDEGSTGVAKYLAAKSPVSTGVAKYLASKTDAPKTGVSKYMAKQVVAAKQAAAEKATGVEKYLRNKG
jgi:hypothetical protein